MHCKTTYNASMLYQVDKLSRIWIATVMLLIYFSAQICEGQQTFGRKPSTYNSMPKNITMHGWFLNTDDPANCNGTATVVAWDFCYYSNSTIEIQNNITVAVWRREADSESSSYVMVNDSKGQIMIQPQADALYITEFICQKWELNSNTAFSVKNGDIVGAYFSENVSVHILGSVQGQSVLKQEHFEVLDKQIKFNSTTKLDDYGLYLEAILDQCNAPSTTTITTTPPTTKTTPVPPEPTTTDDVTTGQTSTTNTVPETTEPETENASIDMKILIIALAPISILLLTLIIITVICLTLCFKHQKLRRMAPYATNMSETAALRDISGAPTVVLEGFTNLESHSGSNGFISQNELSQMLFVRNISPSSSDSPAPSHHSNAQTTLSHEYPTPAAATKMQNRYIQSREISTFKEKPPPFPFSLQPSKGTREYSSTEVKRSNSENGCVSPQETPHCHKLSSDKQKRLDELCESTESIYPYVLHSREALGHTPLAMARSLPNIFQGDIVNSPCSDNIYAVPDFGMSPKTLPYQQGTPIYSYPYSEIPIMWARASNNAQTVFPHLKRRTSEHHFGSVPDLTPKQKASFFIPSVDPSDSNNPASNSNCQSFTVKRNGSQTRSTTCAKAPPHCASIVTPGSCTKKFTPPPTKPKPRPRTKLKQGKDFKPLTSEIAEESQTVTKPNKEPGIFSKKDHTSANPSPLELKPHGYMKLKKGKMDEYVALYQHLLHGHRRDENFMQSAAVMESEFEETADSSNKIVKGEGREGHDHDQSKYETFSGGKHEYECKDEYLETVSDFIGSAAVI